MSRKLPQQVTGLWVALLVAGLCGGAWYFTVHRLALTPQAAGARHAVPLPSPPKPILDSLTAGSGSSGKMTLDLIEVEIAEGDRFLERGEYDRAILAYENGLMLDPANKKLRTRIGRARRARAAEAKYLHE